MSKANEQKIRDLIQNAAGDTHAALPDDRLLQDIPGWDSLRHAEFIISLQREFKIRLSPSEIAALVDLSAAFRIVEERTRA